MHRSRMKTIVHEDKYLTVWGMRMDQAVEKTKEEKKEIEHYGRRGYITIMRGMAVKMYGPR